MFFNAVSAVKSLGKIFVYFVASLFCAASLSFRSCLAFKGHGLIEELFLDVKRVSKGYKCFGMVY